MSGKIALLLALVSILQYTAFAETKTVACYFTSHTVYRKDLGKFKALDIDPNLCTHIFYAFEGIASDGSFEIIDKRAAIELNQIEDIISLKQRNPDLKILVSVGGDRGAFYYFRAMTARAIRRTTFITTSIDAIKKYGFDGLDLVWEYPRANDKVNFAKLLEEASVAFKNNSLLLTAEVAHEEEIINKGYDVPVLSKNLDLITLKEHDFHGAYKGYTGASAPLYYSAADRMDTDRKQNVNASVSYWISLGADPQKLLLGVPFYGKSYRLKDKENRELGAKVLAGGPQGPYTKLEGLLGYNEICELQAEGGWTVGFEPSQKVPYMYKDDIWVSYDNAESLKSKVQYAKENNLQGVSVWSLGTDDFHGTCGKPNILLNAINDALKS